MLDFRYYGPIEGRIVGIDRSGSDALRLTLDRVRLDRVAPDQRLRRQTERIGQGAQQAFRRLTGQGWVG